MSIHSEQLKSALTVLLLASIVVFLSGRFASKQKGLDFPDFYAAGKMVLHGYGHQIYDPKLQYEFQSKYIGRTGSYFIHPSFELLIYLPLCLLPIKVAYMLWLLLNGVFLILTTRILHNFCASVLGWQILLPLSLMFPPIILTFIQGQDSILLLFLLAKAFELLAKENFRLSGCWLAAGLFKFHIVLPIAFVVIIFRRKTALGFLLSSLILVGLSLAISGPSFFAQYLQFLSQLSTSNLSGVHPQAMANLRGIIATQLKTNAFIPIALLSLFLVTMTIIQCAWFANKKPALLFSLAIVTATLISYHLSPHDLSILILPVCLLIPFISSHSSGALKYVRVCFYLVCSALFLPITHIFLLAKHEYMLMVLPIIGLYVVTYWTIRVSPFEPY